MNFAGSFEELKDRLNSLDGKWDESKPDRKTYRLSGGLMNWHHETGKITFQGKIHGKSLLEKHVPNLLEKPHIKPPAKPKPNPKTPAATTVTKAVKLKADVKSKLTQRIEALLAAVSAGMHEREQVLAVALLGAIAGHNTFLFGPPGTAKSLISRRIARAFENPAYFEYLMNRFSTPEEVFGPVSLKELKEDRYTRQIAGYLPTADFAFLDEIWKSSPAILNSLLTIINEHIFKNGAERVRVPLKSLIAASNEVPAENQGLDALYDRFIIRMVVPPIREEENFNRLMNSKPSSDSPEVDDSLLIKYQELANWRELLHDVTLSQDTTLVIKYIREQLVAKYDELKVYVSDRRWQRAAMLLKASAYFNGRDETNHSDVLLLKHCLWTTPDNQPLIAVLVNDAVKSCGFNTDIDLHKLDKQKDALDKEINQELYYSEDVYKTESLRDGKNYFRVDAVFKYRSYGYNRNYDEKMTLYIPESRFKSKGEFHPTDQNGNEFSRVSCDFDGQGTCKMTLDSNHHDYAFEPKVLFHRGDKKQAINERLISSLAGSVTDMRAQLTQVLKAVESKCQLYKSTLNSPFVSESETDVAVDGILKQIEQLKLRIADCERLESLCSQ